MSWEKKERHSQPCVILSLHCVRRDVGFEQASVYASEGAVHCWIQKDVSDTDFGIRNVILPAGSLMYILTPTDLHTLSLFFRNAVLAAMSASHLSISPLLIGTNSETRRGTRNVTRGARPS